MSLLKARASTWLLTAVFAALIALWFVSRWWTLFFGIPNGPFVGIHAGLFLIGYGQPNGWHNGITPWIHRVWNWLPRAGGPTSQVKFYAFMPIWIVAIPLGIWMIRLWRHDASILPTACPACGYDKRGLAAGAVCPECGGKGQRGHR